MQSPTLLPAARRSSPFPVGRTRVRRLLAAVVTFVAVLALCLVWTWPVSATTTDFVIYGRGYGHGAGMSQWGAWQGAREGNTYEQILAFYYPGSSLGAAPAGSMIKVRISKDPASSAYEDQFYRVYLKPVVTTGRLVLQNSGSADVNVPLAVGEVVETLYTSVGGVGRVSIPGRGTYDHVFLIPDSDTGRVAVSMQVSSTAGATSYREYWGRMNVEPMSGGALYLHNYVSLDKYAQGVAEIMPEWAKSSYPSLYAIEAVKAQAVAARTYAYAEFTYMGYVNDDTRDICYKGYSYELANPGAAQAAADTGTNILRYSGVLRKTFFSAHSGGYTSATAWSDDPPSYVVSQPDPWSAVAPPAGLTSIAPGYAWTATFSTSDLAAKLIDRGYIDNVGTITGVEVIARDTSDAWSHATLVRVTGTAGSDTVSARNFRYALGLRSTLFNVNAELPQAGGVRYQQSDSRIVYQGSWYNSSDSTFKWANAAGAVATVKFQGTGIDLYGKKAPRYGIAAVSLDGGAPVDVDFYCSYDNPAQLVHSFRDLEDTSHTLTVTWQPKRNPASTGTYITVDSVVVQGTLLQAPAPAAQPAAQSTGTMYQQTDSRIAYQGPWHDSMLRTLMWANGAGATATIWFKGTGINYYATTKPRYGIAAVSLDGCAPVDVDFYSSTDKRSQLLYSAQGLEDKTHTLTITWQPKRNPASTGTYINLDFLIVNGVLIQAPTPMIQQTDSRISYAGPWYNSMLRTLKWANGAGAVATVTFEGTGIDFYATTKSRYGIASVSLDGGAPVEVDFYSPVDMRNQRLFTAQGLENKTHTLTITWQPKRNPASTGTYINIDWLLVYGM